MRLTEFAPSPDRDDNDDVPDQLVVLANRWWNATDRQPQIEHVLNSLGWSIHQVESEDDAVQLQHRDGTTYFISADDFDPDLFEISDELRRNYLHRAGKVVDRRMDHMARVRDRLNKGYEIYHADRPANGSAIVDRFEADTPALARQYYERFITRYESDVDFDLQLRRATGITESLSSMVSQDQAERNEYSQFVKSKAGGDWNKGAKLYAQLKNRSANDIFGDTARLNQFMKMKFNFAKFTDDNWNNYWLLAQHCDSNRDFQKQALATIKKYQGEDNSHYQYLYDRISCGLTGNQKYGTQDICGIDKQGLNEAVNPIRQQAGKMIDKYFGKIYEYGDSGLDYLDNHAPTWYALSDQYNGDIDVIITTAPANLLAKAAQELKKVAGDLGYELSEAAGQQYLWHGSTQQIPVLTPRQSVDTGGATGSNQNAIYATKDPKVAIAMGLTTRGSDTGMFPNDPQMVLFKGQIRKGQDVYLHKLPMNGPDGKPQFVQGGNTREFYSKPGVTSIKPVEIKAVPVDKYLNLIRTATPKDLELQKKYSQQVNEIARIPQGDFGDKDTLTPMPIRPKTRPLPGGSRFSYAVNKKDPEFMEIMIFDGDTLAAELDLGATLDPLKTWQVETIATDPDYRGQGLGKALYGIALTILKLTLEAGETQTKHGQAMWLMLNSIPGVEVLGYAMDRTAEYRPKPGDKIVDQNDTWTRYTFPVEPGRRSMRSTRRGTGIYSSQHVSMIAQWTGS